MVVQTLATMRRLAAGALLLSGLVAPALALDGSATGGRLMENGEIQMAQMSGSDLAVRLQQLEGQLRGMNGRIEQLEFQNRRLQEQLQRFQGDVDFRFQEMQGSGRPAQRPAQKRTDAGPPPGAGEDTTATLGPGQGAPPTNLGRMPAQGGGQDPTSIIEGGPQGGGPGAPMVLSPPGGFASPAPGAMPSAPPQRPVAAPVVPQATETVVASTGSARDEFDLGVGFIQRKDYELAEITLRRFLQEHPDDRLAADANYWLGESLFQRSQYRPAAEIFLKVTTGSPQSARAPDSMLRLGMSLSGLGEREAACATYAEVMRKYPRASGSVKSQVDREQKRVKC